MAVGLNKIMVIGNLGTDPEMRYTPNGKGVTTFRLAVNRVYRTNDDEKREETEWFTVVAWERLAEQCNQYLAKGRRAYVEGRFRSRTWEGKDGQQRVSSEIIAGSVMFLDQMANQDSGASESSSRDVESSDISSTGVEQPTSVMEPDDLPF